MYTLLVWEENPEAIKMYLIPNDVITDQYRAFLQQAHNRMINSDEMNDGMKFLNHALCPTKDTFDDDGFEQYVGVFSSYIVNNNNPITDKVITAVYLSGFCL